MRPAKLIAIAVVRDADRFLIGLRPPDVPLAGYFEFPGGKVEPHETAADAAVRECREEAGLDVVPLIELESCEHDYEHARVQLRFFECRCVDVRQLPREPFRWVARDELSKLKFPDANRSLVARLSTGLPLATVPVSDMTRLGDA